MQLFTTIGLLGFFLLDFKANIRNPTAQLIEILLASFMMFDVIFLTYLVGCRLSFWHYCEWLVVIGYTLVLALLELHKIGMNSQIFEFSLLITRFLFSVSRTFILIHSLLHKDKIMNSKIDLSLEEMKKPQVASEPEYDN